MVINKNTWHYKMWERSFNDVWDIPITTNLCSYFHRVFWTTFSYILWWLCLVVMACGLLYFIFYIGFWKHTALTFAIVAALATFVGGVFLIVRWRTDMNSREPGVVGQWLRAKKQKVCPVIEFTGDE